MPNLNSTLRWLLVLPSVIAAAAVVGLTVAYVGILDKDEANGLDDLLIALTANVCGLSVFVYAGSRVAPSSRVNVALALFVMAIIWALTSFVAGDGQAVRVAVFQAIGAAVGLYCAHTKAKDDWRRDYKMVFTPRSTEEEPSSEEAPR